MQKVERITADVVVAERLKKWIIDNKLQPGDRLPTEQMLSEELGVARHTIREGIKRLSQLGIVESRTGAGLFMCDVSFNNFVEYMQFLMNTNYITIENISHVRLCLECYSAEDAARNADEAHVEKLGAVVERMEEIQKDQSPFDLYIQADIDFHLALAEATNNPLLKGIIAALKDVIFKHMSHFSVETVEKSYKEHIEIYNAVKAHDAKRAGECMREHLIAE